MQTGRWKKTLSYRASELFETGSSMNLEKITDPLYKEIGRLKMDIEWLKKNEEELSVAERRSFIDPCDTEMSDSKSVRAFGIEPLRLLPIIVAL